MTYTLTDAPAGLTFDAATRTLSGTPTTRGTRTLTYTATCIADSMTETQMFMVTVITTLVLPVPTIRTYTVGTAVNEVLPESSVPGIRTFSSFKGFRLESIADSNNILTYTLTGRPDHRAEHCLPD